MSADIFEQHRKDPAGCVADALQCCRIPGTRDMLGVQYDGQTLRWFGDAVVSYLKMYNLEIVPRNRRSDAQG